MQSFGRQAPDLGQQFPRPFDGLGFEVVTERPVAQHLEEGVVVGVPSNIFQVVVLAASADAFLGVDGTDKVTVTAPEENVLELVHPGIGKQQGGVVMRDHRARIDHGVLVAAEQRNQETADELRPRSGAWLDSRGINCTDSMAISCVRNTKDSANLCRFSPKRICSVRTPIIGGNWKMNLNAGDGADLAESIAEGLARGPLGAEVVMFPAFPYLALIADVVESAPPMLGAQDAHHEASGAFTGEVSLPMLEDCGVEWVLVGHSERRHVIGESNDIVREKLHAALNAGFSVILCTGELKEEREAGRQLEVNRAQLAHALEGLPAAALSRLVIAYEPVWAIGTGLTATPEDAQEVHADLRAALAEHYDQRVADAVRIQYGGSVKPANAAELFAKPDVDGFLVGGASLKSADFLDIINAVTAAKAEGQA